MTERAVFLWVVAVGAVVLLVGPALLRDKPAPTTAGDAGPTSAPAWSEESWSAHPSPYSASPSPYSASPPSRPGDEGHDEGVISTDQASPASVDEPAARRAAIAFATAWIRTDLPAERWRRELARLSTPALARQLSTADPATVPSRSRADTPVSVRALATGVCEAQVPMEGGILTLRLVAEGHTLLVDAIDWSAS